MTEPEIISSTETQRPDAHEHPRLAGGIFLLLGPIVGIVGGILAGQPSFGMIAGLVGGGVMALLVWLADRKRG